MRLLTHLGLPAFACFLAAGCGGSPTAPSSTAGLAPTAAVFTQPFPAPVSQTATGTWYLGERRFMTLTQDGASVTGMPSPAVFNAGGGVIVSESGLISGVVDGNRVILSLTDRITLGGSGTGATCIAMHAFTGELEGNTLSGTMTAEITPLTCSAGAHMPDIELPVSGPTTYTRQ